MNTIDKQNLVKAFKNRFGVDPIIVRSPGRINLIGEHTDYNDGFVLPAAIDKAVYVAIASRKDDLIRLVATEYNDEFEISLPDVAPSSKKPWTNYILGVVDQLGKQGCQLSGFELMISGDVPPGAGLSSSAAVECATSFALNKIFELGLNRLELTKLSQQAEHEFAGVKCGIMDQFASMFGKRSHAIKLDCRSLEYEYIPLSIDGYKIILFDTQVKHSLASSAYNTRRKECEESVSLIQSKYPYVKSLRDATLKMVEDCVKSVNLDYYKRAEYVVNEINRVQQACEDLKRGDLKSFGAKMFQTHEGLSKQFEVSCSELDFLVDQVRNNSLVLGARMMGGGFGGCTINIIKSDAYSSISEKVMEAYHKAFGIDLKVYDVSLEDGTRIEQP